MTKFNSITILILATCFIAGCNSVGNVPEGMSPEETKKAFAELPLEKQIEHVNGAPIPQAEKDKQIAELKAKAGK